MKAPQRIRIFYSSLKKLLNPFLTEGHSKCEEGDFDSNVLAASSGTPRSKLRTSGKFLLFINYLFSMGCFVIEAQKN